MPRRSRPSKKPRRPCCATRYTTCLGRFLSVRVASLPCVSAWMMAVNARWKRSAASSASRANGSARSKPRRCASYGILAAPRSCATTCADSGRELRPYTACVLVRGAVVALALVAATAGAGCSSLLSADPTPVPGAAATLTRSVRTPIPTPERSAASPVASASPARVASAASPGPSPAASNQTVSEAEVSQLQLRMEQIVASSDLPGVESLLLDHVSFSTAQGGSIMDATQAASWLRDRAGNGIKVARLDRGTQSLVLQV